MLARSSGSQAGDSRREDSGPQAGDSRREDSLSLNQRTLQLSHSVAPTRLYIFLDRWEGSVSCHFPHWTGVSGDLPTVRDWSGGGAHVSAPRPGSRAAICCVGSPLAERWNTCSHPSDWLRGAPCPYLERNPRRQRPRKPRLAHWNPPTYVLTRTRAMAPVDDGGRKRRQVSLLWLLVVVVLMM